MTDKRHRLKADPPDPRDRCKRRVHAYLTPDEYEALYALAQARKTSLAGAIRQLIQDVDQTDITGSIM